jgi:hypothetical protein
MWEDAVIEHARYVFRPRHREGLSVDIRWDIGRALKERRIAKKKGAALVNRPGSGEIVGEGEVNAVALVVCKVR